MAEELAPGGDWSKGADQERIPAENRPKPKKDDGSADSCFATIEVTCDALTKIRANSIRLELAMADLDKASDDKSFRNVLEKLLGILQFAAAYTLSRHKRTSVRPFYAWLEPGKANQLRHSKESRENLAWEIRAVADPVTDEAGLLINDWAERETALAHTDASLTQNVSEDGKIRDFHAAVCAVIINTDDLLTTPPSYARSHYLFMDLPHPGETRTNIQIIEMLAILCLFEQAGPRLHGKCLTVRSDNAANIYSLVSGKTNCPILKCVMEKIERKCAEHQIYLVTEFVPTHINPADLGTHADTRPAIGEALPNVNQQELFWPFSWDGLMAGVESDVNTRKATTKAFRENLKEKKESREKFKHLRNERRGLELAQAVLQARAAESGRLIMITPVV